MSHPSYPGCAPGSKKIARLICYGIAGIITSAGIFGLIKYNDQIVDYKNRKKQSELVNGQVKGESYQTNSGNDIYKFSLETDEGIKVVQVEAKDSVLGTLDTLINQNDKVTLQVYKIRSDDVYYTEPKDIKKVNGKSIENFMK